jgi:ABC-type Fe3+-hydroxamate transport system substrate-binding protein
MKIHPLWLVVILAALSAAVAVGLAYVLEPPGRDTRDVELRIVSVMPPITETLFEIGAGDFVVGRSDYCENPPITATLPPCGSARTPNVEAIARLQPTLILSDDSVATAHEKLSGLGKAEFIPWLTADETIAGTRRLGRLTGKEEAANRLADELEVVLTALPPKDGPRVLLCMAHRPGQLQVVSFMRRNSLHGRVLNAAGGRNAADFDVTGVPEMSIEKAIELDPDMIIILAFAGKLSDEDRAAIIADWQKLTPLKAVRHGRISVLEGRHLVPAARRTFRLVDELKQEIARLGR